MKKERTMAIFIGLIMLTSLIGFALNSAIYQQGNQTQGPQIPSMVDRELTTDEIVYVLRTGRVLIENFYADNCSECLDRNTVLQSFTSKYSDFVVLENVASANETMLQMVGSSGKIVDLVNESITENNLLHIFCDVSIVQPQQCLLLET